jgi:hypothetical protein
MKKRLLRQQCMRQQHCGASGGPATPFRYEGTQEFNDFIDQLFSGSSVRADRAVFMQLSHQRKKSHGCWGQQRSGLTLSACCLTCMSGNQPKPFVGNESYDVVITPN